MSVDFSAPITEVVVRAAAVANSRVTLRLDGMNGQVLARLNLVNSGDSQTYQDNRVDLSGMKDLSGIHDIYLVFDEAASINWIEFKASGTYSFPYLVSAVSLVPVTVNPTAVPPVVNISRPNVPTSPTTKMSKSKPKIKTINKTKKKKRTK